MMSIETFPEPRASGENHDFLVFTLVNSLVAELKSYPSGISLTRIEESIASDYPNIWPDIMLVLLGSPNIVVHGEIVEFEEEGYANRELPL